jgi:hypothetical protein
VQGSPFLAISAWNNVRFNGLAFGARRKVQGPGSNPMLPLTGPTAILARTVPICLEQVNQNEYRVLNPNMEDRVSGCDAIRVTTLKRFKTLF